MPGMPAGSSWGQAAGLGLCLLAVVPLAGSMGAEAQERAEVTLASDAFLAPQPGPPPAHFTVVGVVIAPGRSLVFLQEPALTQNTVVAVARGDSIGPYRVAEIETDRVLLHSQDREYAVLFSRGASPAVASAGSARGGGGIEMQSGQASAEEARGSAARPQAMRPARRNAEERIERPAQGARSGQDELSLEARRALVEERVKEALAAAAARGAQNRPTAPPELKALFGVAPGR
jgi:hypothetical protein